MKQVFQSFISHKDLYTLSISLGGIMSLIMKFFTDISEKQILGISMSLWFIALLINIIDIHTGIKADTARKQRLGESFVFKSGKGWRAFEKILIFTLIVWFIYSLELDVVRLKFWDGFSSILIAIKFIMLIYVVLIELQSIGENEVDRFGEKSKTFIFLDKIIEIANEGILTRIRSLINVKSE